jgi:RNA 2',3'-cyclic 3'-phosphodiesterase
MRLFVAIDLPSDAKQSLAKEQQRIARCLTSIRLVRPAQMHLTLVFLGEVSDTHVPAVIDAMNADVALPPFDVVFGGIGVFPPRGAPRALWIGIAQGVSDLVALHDIVSNRVASLGLALGERSYRPHLTIARWRESRSSERRKVEEASTGVRIATVRVERATLFESQLSSGGPNYTPLAHATLTPAGRRH